MSNAHSSRYGQGWAELQRDKEHIRAFQGLFNAAVAGAVAWAAFAAILAILWGVML